MKILRLTFFSLLWTFLIASNFGNAAHAGYREEIDALKAQIETLRASNQNYANVINSINEMRQELQLIKGQMETAGMNKVEKDSTYKELENRILALENKISQLHTLFSDFKKTNVPSTSTSSTPPSAIQEYNQLLALFGQANYREAISGLMGFAQKYPNTAYAQEAQYWIAEGYFSLNDFVKAISEYQKFAEANPTHAKTKTAIYRQGVAFLNIKSYPEAKLFFQKVMSSFPGSPEANDSRQRIVRIDQILGGQKVTPSTPATTKTSANTDPMGEVL
ncbi:MAG: outer membrane protein assembly factor BamD [Deltaproteobacteria bacterium]|nr:outer membrane protein assembly factor BamD [Deltaproteobacteria bacterium]